MKQFIKILKQKSTAGAKLRFNSKMKMFAFSVLAMLCLTIMAVDMKSGLIMMAAAPVVTLAKYAKKEEDLTDEEKALLGTIEERINSALDEFGKGVMTADDFKTAMEEVKKLISDSQSEGASEEVEKELKELKKMMKDASKEILELKDKGFKLGGENPLEKALDEMLEGAMFKSFIDGKQKASGKIKLEVKDIVSLANSYTGTILGSQQTNRVVEPIAERRLNLRDVMTTDQGDPKYPSLTYLEITDLDRGAAAVSENGRLPKSSFKAKESTESVRRIGTYMQISKRLLKSKVYVKSWLMNRMPKWVKLAEDFQIMHGDGQGENLDGIAKRTKCVSDWLNDSVAAGVAGDVIAIDSYNDGKQIKVTFRKPFEKIAEGMKIVFAGAPKVGEAANPLHTAAVLHKESDRGIVVDTPYAGILSVAGTALTVEQLGALTFTVKNNFFNQVADADLGDAVKAIFAILTYAEYTPNVMVLNPSTVFEIETAKDTTGRTLDLVRAEGGVKRIAGRVIVESTSIAPGFYFAGDFANGASLVDYGAVEMEFVEDVECKITGYVVAIIQEELIMPVYNKYSFAYGRLSDVKTAITKIA